MTRLKEFEVEQRHGKFMPNRLVEQGFEGVAHSGVLFSIVFADSMAECTDILGIRLAGSGTETCSGLVDSAGLFPLEVLLGRRRTRVPRQRCGVSATRSSLEQLGGDLTR